MSDSIFELVDPGLQDGDLMDRATTGARIKVVGLGGAGGNAINNMIEAGLGGVEFLAVNTDCQDLAQSKAPLRVQIGHEATRGLGTGANPELGRRAAEENLELITQALDGADMIFLAAGMGGGNQDSRRAGLQVVEGDGARHHAGLRKGDDLDVQPRAMRIAHAQDPVEAVESDVGTDVDVRAHVGGAPGDQPPAARSNASITESTERSSGRATPSGAAGP